MYAVIAGSTAALAKVEKVARKISDAKAGGTAAPTQQLAQ